MAWKAGKEVIWWWGWWRREGGGVSGVAINEDGRLGDDMNRLLWRTLACQWVGRRSAAAGIAAGEAEAAGPGGSGSSGRFG